MENISQAIQLSFNRAVSWSSLEQVRTSDPEDFFSPHQDVGWGFEMYDGDGNLGQAKLNFSGNIIILSWI